MLPAYKTMTNESNECVAKPAERRAYKSLSATRADSTYDGFLRVPMDQQGGMSLTEGSEGESEDLDNARQHCRAHTRREQGCRKSNGLFLITFLLNGISEEGIRLDALSYRKPNGRSREFS